MRQPVQDRSAPLAGTMLLVTDDDIGVRSLISFVLERAGSTVVQAGTGREAVAVVRERCADIDAVLLDVMMPEMNGPEALPVIRGECPGLPVVFFSGFDRNEVADHLVDPPAYTSFVPKPCEHAELIAEMQRAVGSRP
jgi:two-component system, cell cycle sensor histidine kinase and response regulator CckA